MIVVVPSIPHTGTQFVFHDLLGFLQPEIRNPKRTPHGKIWIHIYPERIKELLTLTSYPWITPLRHPIKVVESWKGRKKDLNYLNQLWEILLGLPEPMFLPIDHERKQVFLDRINERLGTRIQTTWENTTSTGYREDLTQEETERLKPFVEFYERTCSA